MRRRVGVALVLPLVVSLALAGCGGGGNETDVTVFEGTTPPVSDAPDVPTPTTGQTTPTSPPTTPAHPATPSGPPEVVATIATGLEAPWGLDFFADGDAIVTERDTRRVLRVTPAGKVTELGVVEAARPTGGGAEDGLLGVALSPDFEQDTLVYLYLTTATDNRVVRTTLRGGRLGTRLEVLLDGIPNGFIHDGGRLEFGPDGLLYVSTGESGEGALAQDRDSLGGKVLRLTPDGDPAPGNPFGTPVYSFGHRNIQGLAFDDAGRLWASEFGDKTFDELNRIEAGGNYGWPEVEGVGGAPTYVDPQQTWATDDNSPSGLAYTDGSLWMAALKGERLWRVTVKGGRAVAPKAFFVGDYGRMRTVAVAPDGTLWLTTSNRDGRGTPRDGDDRILQVQP
ncbi:sorbosone dehydrogenase family protein [Nocardioides sp.]|uniref:PQQ-dependent sugar dehydrogenase n=1 Tax=Nocardioides sp. TaxID=35761 RepID=UPI00271D4FF2|nr:PQQ-dependent sugar dehydrogenase [Nocardioides sp.]MDO9457552.1 PQQ-dependent sugar dehydrogenase [Nocardioides sp.]